MDKCAVGDAEISLAHNGDVYPCHLLHVDGFCAGNIKEQPIAKILSESTVLSNAQQLNVLAREECVECPVRLLCGGACRARAYYLMDDVNSCDSFCDYEFNAFLDGLFRSNTTELA